MVLKELILRVSSLGRGGGGLKRTDFNSFYFEGGSGGLERTDFNNFHFGEEVVVLKELIFTISTLGTMWWSQKN